MQLRHLRYFVKVYEAGSISRAAALVHVAQPALSQQISELEAKLGVPLLHRHARGVRPTAAGTALYQEALVILRQIERLPGLVRSTDSEPDGVVDLGMSSTLAAILGGDFVRQCRQRLPGVMVKFHVADSETLKLELAAQALDLALVFEDVLTAGYVRTPLFRQRLYWIGGVPPEEGAVRIPVERLAGCPLVLPTPPNILRSVVDREFALAGVRPNVVSEGDQWSSIMALVHQGLGSTILPLGLLANDGGARLAPPLRIEPPMYLTASVTWSADTTLNRAAEAVRRELIAYVEGWASSRADPGLEKILHHSP